LVRPNNHTLGQQSATRLVSWRFDHWHAVLRPAPALPPRNRTLAAHCPGWHRIFVRQLFELFEHIIAPCRRCFAAGFALYDGHVFNRGGGACGTAAQTSRCSRKIVVIGSLASSEQVNTSSVLTRQRSPIARTRRLWPLWTNIRLGRKVLIKPKPFAGYRPIPQTNFVRWQAERSYFAQISCTRSQ